MDKNILKKFAIESRQELMDKIRNKIKTFYIDEDFDCEQKGEIYILSNEKHSLSLTNEEFKKRELLIKRVRELSLGQVIEEAAYTWFNRIIAIRYMEINDMLPLTKNNQSLGIRVLSSRDNTPDPEILKFTNLMNPDLDIDFKKEKYAELKDDNEKFKYILLLVCKKLGRVIPQVFDGITDYIDILIPDNLLNDTGLITKIINEVPQDNYNQVEIIGWLYQYYNQTEKDRVINAKKAYKKNEIPYATQLFTPDWIVKYMVENSLGRYWYEHSRNDEITGQWQYFIKSNIVFSEKNIIPQDITVIDPCCGSGHILVYAFELLYQIYESEGYNKGDIAELILKNNIYGLDIDDRAGQLSILSILLKAREYDKNIFNKEITRKMNILSIQESNSISSSLIDYVNDIKLKEKLNYLIDKFKNAKEIGSLIQLEENDYGELYNYLEKDNTIFGIELREKIFPLLRTANILSKKYNIVVTNPPYMSNSFMSENTKKFLTEYYKDYKSDLFSSFIIRLFDFSYESTYIGSLSPYVWMFIKTYEKLREVIVNNKNILSLVQLEYNSFEGACVPVCTFILKNNNSKIDGVYIKLSDFRGIEVQPIKCLEAINNDNCSYKYVSNIDFVKNIPGMPISYWASKNIISTFKNELFDSKVLFRQGMATSDNNRFLRYWYEVDSNKESFDSKNLQDAQNSGKKWFAYNKGGEFRKWYGNHEYVVNWENDGKEMKEYTSKLPQGMNVRLKSREYYFKECFSWSKISSSKIAFRYYPNGFAFDVAGCCAFDYGENLYYYLGLANSIVVYKMLEFISPTMNYELDHLKKIPIIFNEKYKNEVDNIVKENINLAKDDWDSFETSWNFKKHPLLKSSGIKKIKDSFDNWSLECSQRFKMLKQNEEKLNELMIIIYELGNEMSPEVNSENVMIYKSNMEKDIKSFISYAVGCMFGRYSLDKDGLIYAGGDFDNVYQKYKKADGGWAGSSLSNYKYLNDNGNEVELSFEVDNDNIIPITDEAYFSDDIVERFKTFIKVVYGDNTFNENMDFIAEALGKKGTETSEETIRRYFVNDFFNDHVKIYQKRPIYWLLDSGKKNGFKALVYMHRYNENLIPKARLDYLHRVQTTYEKLLSDVNYKLTTDLSMTEKKEAKNRQADLNAKLTEIKEYDEKIAHIANQRISIDLDDGVKVNYEKFKDILAKIK